MSLRENRKKSTKCRYDIPYMDIQIYMDGMGMVYSLEATVVLHYWCFQQKFQEHQLR